MKHNRWIRLGKVAATALFAVMVPANLMSVSHAQTSSAWTQPILQELIPAGTKLATHKAWNMQGTEYAVATTAWSPSQPTPWMLVAKRVSDGWTPLYIGQTQHAFAIQQIVIGHPTKIGTTVSLGFIVDAATALMTHVYTLQVTRTSAQVVAQLPTVVGLTSLTVSGSQVRVAGLNLLATELVSSTDTAHITAEPLPALLGRTTHPVPFVMGWTLHGANDVKRIAELGPAVVHAHVGDTLSFVPMNSQAVRHMLGSISEQGAFSGISVYAAPPGTKLSLYQAAQVLGNVVHLTAPGTYLYAIVPPGYSSLSPDADTAVVQVIVTNAP